MKNNLILYLFAVAVVAILPVYAGAQPRDFLTEAEIELVRNAQQIDQRIGVLVKAIDRRFGAMNINSGVAPKKESDDWGPMPEGTKQQLFFDIKRILQKAIDDIDNLAERPDSMVLDPEDKKPKGYKDIFPKAVRSLSAAAKRIHPILKTELDRAGDNAEKGSILDSIDMCEQIIGAETKLSAEMKKAKS